MSPGEVVHMKEGTGPCVAHDWPTEGLGQALIEAMRATHQKGGVNVCRECIVRAKKGARKK